MLNVRSISRHYGELKAVDDVSFTIAKGEIVGLLGHNGAGKTTIMKMLSGYLEPDTGTIEFQGNAVTSNPDSLQAQLGYLPENPPVYPELSVAAYLDYVAELKGLKGTEKRQAIRQVLDATELGSKLLSPIATLSRGMKQRVGVAQAIIGKPSLLILDEPTNGLDPTQTEQMRQVIRNISESATVILSTHIMQEVEALCDRVMIIRQGQLAVDAKLQDLTQSHRIRLRSSAPRASIASALNSCEWFSGINDSQAVVSSGASTSVTEYTLSLKERADTNECLSQTAQCLVSDGIDVLGLQADIQDLQSLFVQVNSGSATAGNTGAGNSDTNAHIPATATDGAEVDHVA